MLLPKSKKMKKQKRWLMGWGALIAPHLLYFNTAR